MEWVRITTTESVGIRMNAVLVHRVNSLMLLRGIRARMPAENNSDWMVLRSADPIRGSNGQAYHLRVVNEGLGVALDSYVLTI